MSGEQPVISEGSVISDQLTADDNGDGLAPRDVKAVRAPRTPNYDLVPVVDLLGEYVSDSEPVLADSSLFAATGEYDLRPLGDELATDGEGGDLLADILAESALVSIR
jgi:hypothetical protein